MIGTTLGHYEVLELLGKGGMGEVYRGQDIRLGRNVAIKVLPIEFAGDLERLARFEQEARAAAALNHPGIAAVYDIGVHESAGDRTHFMVQELLEGQTLQEVLDGGPLPHKKALTLAAGIAAALAAAHRAGVVHRDLKPANVFVTREGNPKILDFGLAKLTEGSTVATSGDASMSPTVLGTMAGTVLGTAGYMAPEQVRGEAVDHRADLFALGCLLHEMLDGGRAFAGKSLPDTLAKILHDEPRLIDDLAPPLARALEKCLSKDAAERYQHADDLEVDLRYLAGTDVLAEQPSGATGTAGISLTAAAAMVVGALLLGALGSNLLGGAGSSDGSRADLAVPVQLTHFSTSAERPGVSPNGQMVAFLAMDPVTSSRQVYVMSLPDGPPLRLTDTVDRKSDPTFSPDGARIAYTVMNEGWEWNMWSVSLTGGEPRFMLRNANSLQWTGDGRILFSKFKLGAHLGIVRADESGGNQEELWFPPRPWQMAHYSDLSPDGSRIVIGYMGSTVDGGVRCFVADVGSMDGEPPSPVIADGPPCSMLVRWGTDGEWIYYQTAGNARSLASNGREIWRFSVADGSAQPVVRTGPGVNDLNGFALTPDGESLIYSAGTSTSVVWLRSTDGTTRRLTFERAAADPVFAGDGRSVVYLQDEPGRGATIWRYDLARATRESVCPGLRATGNGISLARDSSRILVTSRTRTGADDWLCFADASEPPRELDLPPRSGPALLSHDGATVYFAANPPQQGPMIAALDTSGGEPRIVRTLDDLGWLRALSPDGRWLAVSGALDRPRETWLVPIDGGEPRLVVRGWSLEWSPDGSSFLFVNDGMVSSAWVLRNPTGELVPPGMPEDPDVDWLRAAGAVQVLADGAFTRASASPTPFEVTYSIFEERSNLFTVKLPE